jgi:hypothetical protein
MAKTSPITASVEDDSWLSRYDAIALCGNPNQKTFDRWRKIPGFPEAKKAAPGTRLVFFSKRELLAWMARRAS